MQGWWAASYVILWILVVILCFIVVSLARQIGTLHLRLGPRGALEVDDEGPPIGDAPVATDVVRADGTTVTVGGPSHPQVLLFVSPTCHVCEQVMPSIGVAAKAKGMDALVLSDTDQLETKHVFSKRRLDVPVASGQELIAKYRVPGTPYVVILDELGVVRGKGTINNLEQLEGLLDTAQRRAEEHRHAS